jgi:hypothetical protein
MCGHRLLLTYRVKSVIKHFKNVEVHLVVYLYILHLTDTRNMESTKIVNSKLEC